jgi:uncharacterized protein with GYD domain
MDTYVLLMQFTERGIMNVKNTTQRAQEFKQMAIRHGAAVRETFWTLGLYDIVAIVEAPDELAMTALSLSLGALGFVRTQTLRAFSEAGIQVILRKMA